MLWIMLAWYVLGVISWFWFLWCEGTIRNGDCVTAIFMGVTGCLIPVVIGSWELFWKYVAWSDKIIWKRQN